MRDVHPNPGNPGNEQSGAGCAGVMMVRLAAFSGSFLGSSQFRQIGLISSHPPVPLRGITPAVGRLAGLVLCGLRYPHCIDGLEEMVLIR